MVWAAVLPLLPSKWKSFPSRKEKEAEKWDPERVNVATIPADSVTNYWTYFSGFVKKFGEIYHISSRVIWWVDNFFFIINIFWWIRSKLGTLVFVLLPSSSICQKNCSFCQVLSNDKFTEKTQTFSFFTSSTSIIILRPFYILLVRVAISNYAF